MSLWRKFVALFRRDKLDAEMAEEMRGHLELQARDNEQRGLSVEEAHYAARRQFGGIAQVQERCRDERRFVWLDHFIQDIRHGARLLRKSPGFTIAAVLVLALGIGLNTATFSAIYALTWSPRPLAAPDRLVQLYTQDRKEPANFRAFSYAAYRELRERRDLFSGVLAQKLALVAVGEGAAARRALAAVVSANFFDVLGVPLARGRGFTAEEEAPGSELPVVVVSHPHWRDTGFKPDLVGSTVRINGRLHTIVGITPEGFSGTQTLFGPDFYFPLGVFDSLAQGPEETRRRALAQTDVFELILVARLQAGIGPEAAQSALAGVATGLEQRYPIEHQDKAILLGPLPRFVEASPPASGGLLALMAIILLGLTGSVLLIVSLNLAGLLLARGHARRKEFAIRVALGGTRARLVRQLLTEGLVLAILGGALGCLCAVWVTDLVVAAVASRLPVEIVPTTRAPVAVIGATLLFCSLATLLFALGPALTLSRRDLVPDLQQNAGEDTARRRHRWLPRNPLVVAQIALSLALMIGAGLFARMTGQVIASDPGIDAGHTLVAEFDASLSGYERARTLEIFRRVGERLAGIPGVHSVSIADSTPYSLAGDHRSVRRAGTRPAPDARPATAAEGLAFSPPLTAVGADYFATIGLPLLRGRAFSRFEAEHMGGPPVAIVDEALAARLWPGEEVLGRHLEWVRGEARGAVGPSRAETIEIVGIARTAHLQLFEKNPGGAIYVPFAQAFTGNVFFFVRSAHAGEAALAGLRDPVGRELLAAAGGVPFFKVRTFAEHKSTSLELWALHRLSLVSSGFGAGAALIAVIGLYGAKAYGVSRRRREIGIRLALGAEPARLRNLILGEGLSSGLVGIALGLLLGAGLGRLLQSVIGGISAFDASVFGLTAGVLFIAALAASWLPARRAAKVDPMVALRSE